MVGDLAPIFALRDLQDNDVFIRDYCGELRQPWKNNEPQVVLLSFFTTYCQPCLKEFPILIKLSQKFIHQNLKILLVDLKEDKKRVQKFATEQGIKLPVLLDRYGVVAKKYGVTSVPRIFVINEQGKLIWMTKGFSPSLEHDLMQLLNSKFANAIEKE